MDEWAGDNQACPEIVIGKQHTDRHHPRKRVIQYSRALMFITGALEYWIVRSSRTMTVVHAATASAANPSARGPRSHPPNTAGSCCAACGSTFRARARRG